MQTLREYIKKIGSGQGNIYVKIINGEKEKTLFLFMNEQIYEELKELVGEDNLKIK